MFSGNDRFAVLIVIPAVKVVNGRLRKRFAFFDIFNGNLRDNDIVRNGTVNIETNSFNVREGEGRTVKRRVLKSPIITVG